MDNKTLNILFVEDSEDDVELTVAELNRAGYDVHPHRLETEVDMQAALDNHQWDAIISDYKMPEFSAEKSLSVYNRNCLDIPFIIISGVVEAEDVVALLKQGAHDFLNKNALARLIPALEREMRESKVRKAKRLAEQKVSILSLAVEQSPISVIITNPNGKIEYVNPKFEAITGYSSAEAIGQQFGFTIFQEGSSCPSSHEDTHNDFSQYLDVLWQSISQQKQWDSELCHAHKENSLYWESVTISPLEDDQGNIIRFVSLHEDITVRRSYEEQLRHQAYYDSLTNVANRARLLAELDNAIIHSDNQCSPVGLLSIDIDHFKNINDTLGHAIGDELLVQAASRLAACTKNHDIIARMGGDEFVIIMRNISDNQLIEQVAQRIMENFSTAFFLNQQEHFISVSVGAAIYPNNSGNAQELLRHADAAMYHAKSMGRNQYQFFDESIHAELKQQVALERAMRGIESRDELQLLYQPIVDGWSKQVVTCEALLRWRSHDGTYIMPDIFIPVAEETGQINPIGEWVIDQACKDLQYIHQHIDQNLQFAINISPKQLEKASFAEFFAQKINSYGLDANALELEITESILVCERHETHNNLQHLVAMNARLSIDDFGTGYSSLGYLQKYPFSTLKVDRSFVNQLGENSHSEKLTTAIINMAHSLDMKVVAEGVETEEQQKFLNTRHCDMMQGYLFSRPISFDDLVKWLKK